MKSIKFDEKEYAKRMAGTGADRVQDWLFFELKRRFPERYDTLVISLPGGAAALALKNNITGNERNLSLPPERERFLQVYQVLEDIGALMEEDGG